MAANWVKIHPSATSSTIITRKPAITPSVPGCECSPRWASGISSSTTTYSIAPAAAESSHGIKGVSCAAASTTSTPNTGSTTPESAPYANACPRDRCPFGEILYADAERQRACGCNQPGVAVMLRGACEGQADRHSFRDIVQCDREHKQRRAPERGGQPFGLCRAAVQMGQQAVQSQHEQDPEHKAARCGQPADAARGLGLLDRRNEQAPYGRRNHHPGGKSQKYALQQRVGPAAQQEHQGCAQCGHQKGKAGACCGPEQRLRHGRPPGTGGKA